MTSLKGVWLISMVNILGLIYAIFDIFIHSPKISAPIDLTIGILYFVVSIGLIFQKNWARLCFLITSYLALVVIGAYFYFYYLHSMSDISGVFVNAISFLLYFSAILYLRKEYVTNIFKKNKT